MQNAVVAFQDILMFERLAQYMKLSSLQCMGTLTMTEFDWHSILLYWWKPQFL